MIATMTEDISLKVVKRDKKKVNFNGEKIALAIKKAFDSIELNTHDEEDVNKVYTGVLTSLKTNFKDEKSITVEEIQDLIEDELKKMGYVEVLEAFSTYRERRRKSREIFYSRQHKLAKMIEALSLKDAHEENSKRDNANVDGNTAMGTMLQFGSTISKEFAKAYLMEERFADAHDEGRIHIHDMDFWPMATTTCCQIDLHSLFEGGFSTGHGHLRCPNDIISYSALAAIAIQSNQNDQHGGQSIPAFDYYMAPGVVKTFKKQFKQTLYDAFDIADELDHISFDQFVEKIDHIKTIDVDLSMFIPEGATAQIKKIIEKSYQKALAKTDRITYQAMEAFIHNLNTMHSRAGAQVPFSSVNLGTDTSSEGRMVIKNYLLATDAGLGKSETPIFPISIFKVKEGVNYQKQDPNYDLFQLACKVSAKRLFPNFSFIDSPFNLAYYKEGDYKTEIAYMGCRTRVMGNVDKTKEIVTGRGNLSFTSINLPRIGIKHGIVLNEKTDLDGFYQELSELMDLVKDELLQRFELQCRKQVSNFPFLLGQGIWIDSNQLKNKDRSLRKVLKHGTLTLGFIGLAETLKALIGVHHGESAEAQKLGLEIIQFMRNRCDEYKEKYQLNFSLIATPAEGLSGRFTSIDRAIYGELAGITDREYYTNSFHVPVYYPISIVDKLKIEGPYHELTNGGHISYVELDGDTVNNLEAFEQVIRIMHDNHIGYGAINHPVDRDPICGYTGVIGDVCPSCGRKEGEGVPMERLQQKDITCCGR